MNTIEVRMPAFSQTMEFATLLDWLVKAGDEVRQGQPLAEVATDKVNMELESPATGTVGELLVEAGDTAEVGQVVTTVVSEEVDLLGGLSLGGGDESATEAESAAEAAAPMAVPSGGNGGIIPASPPARAMARKLGIDLALVTATGRRGQVTPADVKTFAGSAPAAAPPAPVPAAPAPTAPKVAPVATAAPASVVDERVLATRRATARIMSQSAQIPQFVLRRTLILDAANSRRNGRSWTTELACSLAAALRHHPELNAYWDEEADAPVPWPNVTIGLAVDRPGEGLIVAGLEDVDQLGKDNADKVVREVAGRVSAGDVRPEDLKQASITLSNLGGIGVDGFDALLFPPQAAIVSTGTIKMRPVATPDGGLKAALTCNVGLTIDHRVTDGANAAAYLDTFANLMEGG